MTDFTKVRLSHLNQAASEYSTDISHIISRAQQLLSAEKENKVVERIELDNELLCIILEKCDEHDLTPSEFIQMTLEKAIDGQSLKNSDISS